MKNDSLGDRMKGYEHVTRSSLVKRTPVIIRLDGKAFHTWTKQLKHLTGELHNDPFSNVMCETMLETTKLLVSNIQNAVLGYTQSDEISIVLNDWKTLTTDQWFGNTIQKMASVSSSMATAYFNNAFGKIAMKYYSSTLGMEGTSNFNPAMFDARVFNMPREEVVNYFVWRQQDATRNSVQMLGHHYFSQKEMHKKNVSNIQDMLMEDHNVNWNDLETWKKRGSCVVRGGLTELSTSTIAGEKCTPYAPHVAIQINKEIPIFTQNREFIEYYLK